jgi:hypothetical protein
MDATAIQFQTELNWVMNDPEGVLDGVPGTGVIQAVTGKWYRKTTPIGTKTGWEEIGAGGGSANPVDEQALGGVAPVSSAKYLVLDTDTGFLWYSSTKAAPWINL